MVGVLALDLQDGVKFIDLNYETLFMVIITLINAKCGDGIELVGSRG